MKVIFDLPDGLTERDIPDLKAAIQDWAAKRVNAQSAAAPLLDIRAARIAALQSSHKSLHAFILSNGYPLGTAWEAMRGKFSGPKARQIVEHVKREFGI